VLVEVSCSLSAMVRVFVIDTMSPEITQEALVSALEFCSDPQVTKLLANGANVWYISSSHSSLACLLFFRPVLSSLPSSSAFADSRFLQL